MRAALYAVPDADGLLERAEAWLAGNSAITSSALRYGFHGTLKAPFRLAEGRTLDELDAAAARFAAEHEPVQVPQLTLARLGAFFALVPGSEAKPLHALADDVVHHFEPFRAPLNATEIARRKPEALSENQRELLQRWGYPYVFEEFRFHLTVTDQIPADQQDAVEQRLRTWFAGRLGLDLPVNTLAVFVEPEPGARFHVHSSHPFQPTSEGPR